MSAVVLLNSGASQAVEKPVWGMPISRTLGGVPLSRGQGPGLVGRLRV